MRILLEPGNPHDFSSDELDEIVAAMEAEDPEVEVQIALRNERGYGVTLAEVVHVFVENKDVILPTAGALAGLVKWLAKRWKDGNRRPKSVLIYGPRGEPLKAVRVDASSGEVSEDGVP